MDTYGRDDNSELGLYFCAENQTNPQHTQFFTLRYFRDIELKGTMFCLDQNEAGTLMTSICHNAQGNQYFRYNLKTNQIHHGSLNRNECVDMDVSKMEQGSVFITKCDDQSISQKWIWGFANQTALTDWVKFGSEIIDKQELEMLEDEERETVEQ